MCGVVGIIGTPDAAREAFLGLTTLQHRGQDAAGILTYDTDGFHRVKNLGLVDSVFNRQNMTELTGNVAIAHARYATIGRGDVVDVQPFLLSYPFGLGMVHNGNIVNVAPLAEELRIKNRRHLLTHSDTEIVLNIFAEEVAKSTMQSAANASAAATARSSEKSSGLVHATQPSMNTVAVESDELGIQAAEPELNFEHICTAVQQIFTKVKGSYSIVTLIADHGLVAFRDPNGLRPLVWGRREARRSADVKGILDSGEAHMFASESVALSFMGYESFRDVAPGEVVFVDLNGKVHSKVLTQAEQRPCMFEWVYFASPESVIDEVPVYGARIQLGKNLAKLIKTQMAERKIEADIIVPVPETSRIAAIALAEELAIPYREVLIKNRYIKRTFILDSQEKRQSAVNLKLSPVRSEILGKRVILVDDSIVRGTTSKKIIDLVRKAGASKVYFVSTCPPIQHPCFYGIDFPNESELIASGRSLTQIEQDLGADAVIYQDVEGLKTSILDAGKESGSTRRFNPCTACLDGKYPTDVSSGRKMAETRNRDRSSGTRSTASSVHNPFSESSRDFRSEGAKEIRSEGKP